MKFGSLAFILFLAVFVRAQTPATQYRQNLSRRVTLHVTQVPVSSVLQMMSNAGGFFFSYSGALFNQDSLVNVDVKGVPVRDVIDQIFNGKVDYKEHAEYIILRYAVNHLTIVPENITTADNFYMINGYVIDTETGKKLKQASVYEKRLVQSTLTDNDGYFSLRFRGETAGVTLTASKETYRDTSLVFLADINIKPQNYDDPDKEKGTFLSDKVGRSGVGRFLTSSRQRIQNLNIPGFFADKPFQASLVPGLSSHGMMSPNVVNKASLNVIGGYTAGVNGAEIAGVFNLTKGDVRKVQVAGVFNLVGGEVNGTQISGVSNRVESDVKGVQVAGAFNSVKGGVTGVQVAGVTNSAGGDFNGAQISGVISKSGSNFRGLQIGGVANVAKNDFRGIQIAGFLNKARKFEGFRVALINVADSAKGTSIGLFNFSRDGFIKISLYANELANANLSFKTGNANFYTMLIGGRNLSDTAAVTTFGLGFGHEFIFTKRLSLATEMTVQYVYLGNKNDTNILMKFQPNVQFGIGAGFSLFGGPSYSYYNSDAVPGSSAKNYKKTIVPLKHENYSGNNLGWLGWNAGFSLAL